MHRFLGTLSDEDFQEKMALFNKCYVPFTGVRTEDGWTIWLHQPMDEYRKEKEQT